MDKLLQACAAVAGYDEDMDDIGFDGDCAVIKKRAIDLVSQTIKRMRTTPTDVPPTLG